MLALQDEREILQEIPPRREITENELITIIKQKHQRRFATRQSRLKKLNSS